MKSKHLLFLTAEFPFGSGETFIENELPYLEEAFEKVTIFSLSPQNQQTRKIGENTVIFRHPVELSRLDKIIAFHLIFHPQVVREFWRMCFIYKLFPTAPRAFTVLFSWARALKIGNFLKLLINDETIAYAYWTDDSALALAQLMGRFPKLKSISRFHGWDVYFEVSSINYLPFRSFINQNLTSQVAISQRGLDYASQKWQVRHCKNLKLSRLGTEKQIESPVFKESLCVERTVVSCSNVISVKRVELIFEVLNRVAGYQIKWVHFGDGNQLDKLKRIVDQRVEKHLTVEFKGRIPNDEVLNQYRMLQPDLFINLSTSEGIPVSIMEALSLGIPVLATAVGGTPEIVSEKVGALVAPDASADQIGEVLNIILNYSLSEWNSLSEQAFAVWQANYSAEKNYRSFAAWIKELE